ncbi:hypothetical protein GYMLUDRAFT_54946 [Collybiopsis luxurians FD-317 M1]|nr:hypothetical protein GYMLUDRAFT_54946 [Collybiopsis luxurians FD-317 M1]
MASLTATSYFSHPWFYKTSMKRPHSSSSDDELLDTGSLSLPTSVKRRRVAALERGLSNLSLHPSQHASASSVGVISSPSNPPPSVTSPPSPPLETFSAMEVEYSDSSSLLPSIQPDSIEEPASPVLAVPEIHMKGSSWYEPEPDRESSSIVMTVPEDSARPRFSGIIVTDLDSSDEEEEPEPLHAVVSSVLLERIRQREREHSNIIPAFQDRQALVLYKPLTRPSITTADGDREDDSVQPAPTSSDIIEPSATSVPEVDMMDVE